MFLHDVYGFYNIHEFKNPGENGSLLNGIEYLKPKMHQSNHTLSMWDVIERENIIKMNLSKICDALTKQNLFSDAGYWKRSVEYLNLANQLCLLIHSLFLAIFKRFSEGQRYLSQLFSAGLYGPI